MGAGVRVHVAQQGLVRRGAGRRRARGCLGGEIRPHALPVVGEGRRHPLHPVHRRALAGQRRQDRGPRPHPAVLLVHPEQGEAATAQRERGGERTRRVVVYHAHVTPAGVEQPHPAQCAHVPGARLASPAGAPADRDRQPFVARAARHGDRRQRAVEDEDADGRRHTRRVGLPAQHQHAENEADRHGEDLARPPPRQRAAALAGPEPVARSAVGAHASAPWPSPSPGGHAGGNQQICGPCPSSPM